ncbi:hypothetical protein TNCT_656471 [Trichonephila clavata]|uniref:Uncharacterized protein n=1 Tax=Trichonephila clavata TaxID=2740835 RepID=A0A8X6LED2_TRICU|nr:hypothetical protein TNCT_656471 [Trichonephila clavata]
MEVARTSASGPEVRSSRTWPPGTGMLQEKKVFEGIRRVLCLAGRHRPWSEDPAAGLAASSSPQRNKRKKESITVRFEFPFFVSLLALTATGPVRFPLQHISQGAHQS